MFCVTRSLKPAEQKRIHNSTTDSGLEDQAYQILVQQNRVMEEFVNQQQKNTLPRRRVPVFDGDLWYFTFMRTFETVSRQMNLTMPEDSIISSSTQLESPEMAMHVLGAEEGYRKAKKLWKPDSGRSTTLQWHMSIK